MITSLANHQIKNIIKLQKKAKARDEQGVFVIEGLKMFEEAKGHAKSSIEKAYVSESLYGDMTNQNVDYFEGIQYEVVAEHIFGEMAQTVTPQGILAVVKQPFYQLQDMLSVERIHLVLLEELRDPGNLGTIIRTAEGAGITGVVMSKGCVDVLNPKVIRSTMGSIFRLPFVYVEDFIGTLVLLEKKNIIKIATHLSGDVLYDSVDYSGSNAILIGNEANGLTDEAVGLCDMKVRIPMHGNVESLNASVAAALMMYEVEKTI